MKEIDHDGAIVTRFEMMLMFHDLKRTVRLFINKAQRFLHIGDSYPQYSCLEKMPGFPCHRFIYSNQPKSRSGNGFFVVLLHGLFVQFNIAAKVKDPLYRCFNKSGEVN